MKTEDYKKLILLVVDYQALIDEREALDIQLAAMKTEINAIAPTGDHAINFDDRIFLIQKDDADVSISVIPEVFITESEPE